MLRRKLSKSQKAPPSPQLSSLQLSWRLSTGGGSLSSTAMLSDEGGLASVTYTTGPTAGQAVIKARVNGVPDLAFNILIT
jgi:hypothetical protein